MKLLALWHFTHHWEALKDPNMAEPLAMRFAMTRNTTVDFQPQNPAIAQKKTPILRVLLVTSRPSGTDNMSYRTLSLPLLAMIQSSQLAVQIDLLRPANYSALNQHLQSCESGTYHILHFDGVGKVLNYASLQQEIDAGCYEDNAGH